MNPYFKQQQHLHKIFSHDKICRYENMITSTKSTATKLVWKIFQTIRKWKNRKRRRRIIKHNQNKLQTHISSTQIHKHFKIKQQTHKSSKQQNHNTLTIKSDANLKGYILNFGGVEN